MAGPDYVLQTDRLTLRPLVDEYVEELKVRIVSNPEVVKTLMGDISTPERVDQQARMWITESDFWAAHGFGYWGVFDRKGTFGMSGALLGVVGADEAPPVVGEGAEIYYLFAPAVWGKGVGSEAVSAMCEYLFEKLHLPAVQALIFAELNPGSVRLAEKLGMRPVGRVPLLGHHLSEDRARETIAFDIWRLRTSSRARARRTLEETAFRIGQFLAEEVGSLQQATAALLDAAVISGLSDTLHKAALHDLIEERLTRGMKAGGLAHYRVRREEYQQG